MEELEVRPITVANLPDLAAPCMLAGTLGTGESLPSEAADEMTRGKLGFFHERMRHGAAAMAAYRGNRVVGLLEYYPIEVAPSPVIGEDLFVVNCLQVPHGEHRDEVERELVGACAKDWSSRKGVVALARRKDWGAMGFEEILKDAWPEDDELVLWLMKFWEVEEPRLARVHRDFNVVKGRVTIEVFESGHCPWDFYVHALVAEVAEEFGRDVLLERRKLRTRDDILKYGVTAAVAVDGEYQPWLRPHPIPNRATIRKAIESRL
jgi:hypothetical protein